MHLRCKEVHLDERQLGWEQKRFKLTVREDQHSLKMDKERAGLGNRTSDRQANRQRYNAKTEEGITTSTILNQLCQGPQKLNQTG